MNALAGRRLVIAAVLAFAAFRLLALTRYPLWTDETWTLQSGFGAFRGMLRLHADDQTHPPLYYIALWAWRRLGPDALAWHRLLAALAGIATAVPLVALARRAGLTERGVALAALAAAGSGMLVAYSAEIRNYAFLAFFATLSLATWLRERDSAVPRYRALTIVNILLVWSHYFGVFVVLAELLDAATGSRRHLRKLLGSSAIALVSLAPWIAETVRRAQITGGRLDVVNWIPVPVAGDVLDVPREVLGGLPWMAPDLALAVAVSALIAGWTLRTRTSERWRSARLLVLAVVLPVAAAWIASVLGPKPVWVTRYLIAAAPMLCLLFAAAVDWAVPRRLTTAAITIAAIPGALTLWSLQRGREKPRYDLAMEAVRRDAGDGTAFAFTMQGVKGFPVLYLGRAMAKEAGRTVVMTSDIPPGAAIPVDRGWVIWSEVHPPRGVPPAAMLLRQGFRIDTTLGFGADRDSLVAVRFSRAGAP